MTAFAAIESATADSAVAALANATLTATGVSAPVIFDAAYADAFGMVAGTSPVALAATADVSTVEQGDPITIDAIAYTVTGIEPDGTGLTRLRLNRA